MGRARQPPARTRAPPRPAIQSLIPCRCEGTIDVRAKALTFHGGTLSDLVTKVTLGKDQSELSEAHVQLPGDAKLSASGHFLHAAPAEGAALFDGKIAFAAANPKLFAAWLGVSPDRVPPEALKTLSLSGPFKIEDHASGGGFLVAPHLDHDALAIDSETFTLSAAYSTAGRATSCSDFPATVSDADAFGLGLFWPAAPLRADAWGSTLWGHALRTGDVDVSVQLAHLKTAKHDLRDFTATLKRASDGPASAHVTAGDGAGFQFTFDGERKGHQDGKPGDENAHLAMSGPSAPLHLPFAGKPIAGAFKLDAALTQSGDASHWSLDGNVGATKLSGDGSGAASESLIPDIDRLSIDAKLERGTATLSGSLKQFSSAPVFDGNLTVDADDFAGFLRELGYSYEPRKKDLGALSLVAQLSASLDHVGVTSLSASVGEDSLSATADLNLAGPRANLSADIKAAKISLDGYLAAPEKNEAWSSERLKLDVFRQFDGNIKLNADELKIGPWDLRNLGTALDVKDGAIAARNARAQLFGGAMAFTGTAQLSDDGIAAAFDMNVQNFDWVKAAAKLFPTMAAPGQGSALAHIAGNARGHSLMGLVSGFSGRAELSGSGGAIAGFDLAAWGNGLNGAPRARRRLAPRPRHTLARRDECLELPHHGGGNQRCAHDPTGQHRFPRRRRRAFGEDQFAHARARSAHGSRADDGARPHTGDHGDRGANRRPDPHRRRQCRERGRQQVAPPGVMAHGSGS